MVLQLPGATIAVPGPVRACKVFVNAETLSIATIGHDTIADLPLFHVKELQVRLPLPPSRSVRPDEPADAHPLAWASSTQTSTSTST